MIPPDSGPVRMPMTPQRIENLRQYTSQISADDALDAFAEIERLQADLTAVMRWYRKADDVKSKVIRENQRLRDWLTYMSDPENLTSYARDGADPIVFWSYASQALQGLPIPGSEAVPDGE